MTKKFCCSKSNEEAKENVGLPPLNDEVRE